MTKASVVLHPGLVGSFELCETTRRNLIALLAEFTPGTWIAPGADGAWSAAQQADHLILAEIGTSKMVRRLIRGDFGARARPTEAALHDSRLDAYPYGRLPAPEVLAPSYRSHPETIEQLDAAHRRFHEELLSFKGEDVDAIAAPDPATGAWFTLAGWIRLQALHEAHHLRQIQTLRR